MHISYCSAASLHVQSTDSTCMPNTHMQGVCSVELEFYVVSHCGIFSFQLLLYSIIACSSFFCISASFFLSGFHQNHTLNSLICVVLCFLLPFLSPSPSFPLLLVTLLRSAARIDTFNSSSDWSPDKYILVYCDIWSLFLCWYNTTWYVI